MARSTYEDFIIKEKIGSGSYGVVFKVIRKVDRMTYAMKEIDLAGMSRKEQEECIRETRVLSSLDSDYIIKYYDSFLERGKLYIITEYASNGNLHDYIKRHPAKLREELIWKLFLQILMGLNHMHSKKILHRDIKTLNVFLDDDLNVKLGDMGVAKILSTHTNFAKTIVGTPYYLSPELCEDKPYNEKSDVWALGVVLYECCVQRHPFDADNQGALILKILRGKYPPVAGYSPEVTEVIKCCLTQNANRRPNTYKLLLHPAVRQKGTELGVNMPDQQTLMAMAEKSSVSKAQRPGSGKSGRPASDAQKPADPASAPKPKELMPDQASPSQAQGLIRVVGDMNQPTQYGAAVEPSNVPALLAANQDKAFVFGGTMKTSDVTAQKQQQAEVAVGELHLTAGDASSVAGQANPGDQQGAAGAEVPWWVAAAARTAQAEAAGAAASVVVAEERPASQPAHLAAWTAAQGMAGISLQDDEDEDVATNIYNQPYRDADEDQEDGEELVDDHEDHEEEEEEEEGEEYDGQDDGEHDYEGEEYEEGDYDQEVEEGHATGGSAGGAWQPDPARLQHMRSAMMLQRAACLDLIGDKAFDELYALLKSNQVDEASMTDLSRLVFKIIPYDKSEVIQMMYKLLYLESQLDSSS